MARWVEWIEPFGPNNEPVYMSVPATTAIAVMQDVAKRRGGMYSSDEAALEDFIVVNWATIKERDE